LVANGGLDTVPDSIYGKKGLKVSFKIIDDWTEGAAALATNNVDVMLTTADVYAKDYAQFKEKGFGSHAFLMVDWSRGADGVIGKRGINSIEDLAGKKVAFAPYTPSHFLLWNGLKTSGLGTDQRNEIFNKAVHTKDGIEPATLFAQEKVDAAVAWDPDMSDAVGKRPGSKKIYDTRIANRLVADILVVSDSFCEARVIKHPTNAEDSLDRRYVEKLSDSFSMTSSEAPIEYRQPSKGATPLATQHRSIYFDPNSASMSLDSRAIVDELANTMRAYENTVVDIEGNTDSTGSRGYNIQLSHQRADAVRDYLIQKYGFPSGRLRTAGNGPDKHLDSNATAEGREKNRRT